MKLSRHLINLIICALLSGKAKSMDKNAIVKFKETKNSNYAQVTKKNISNNNQTSQSMFVTSSVSNVSLHNSHKNPYESDETTQEEETVTTDNSHSNQNEITQHNAGPSTEELLQKILINGKLAENLTERAEQLTHIVMLYHEARATTPRSEKNKRKEIGRKSKEWSIQIRSLPAKEASTVDQNTCGLSGYESDGDYTANEHSYTKFKTKNILLGTLSANESSTKEQLTASLIRKTELIKTIDEKNTAYDKLTQATPLLEHFDIGKQVTANAQALQQELVTLTHEKKQLDETITMLQKRYDQQKKAVSILKTLQQDDLTFVTNEIESLTQKITDGKVTIASVETEEKNESDPSVIVQHKNKKNALQKDITENEATLKIYKNHQERMNKRINPPSLLTWLSFGYIQSTNEEKKELNS